MSRWNEEKSVPRGSDYDQRWEQLAAEGKRVHGEADLIEALVSQGSILDAGCGTGRVAIELKRRGFRVVGVDLDDAMLGTARDKDPSIDWQTGDLVDVALHKRFDCVAMPGNVMIFVAPNSEATVIANMAAHLVTDGLLIAGFQLNRRRWSLADYDQWCQEAGLGLVGRFSTWERADFDDSESDYAVSVHQRLSASP